MLVVNLQEEERSRPMLGGIYQVIDRHIWDGQADRAEGMARHLLDKNPDDPDAKVSLARAVAAQGRVTDGVQLLEQVLLETPDHAEAQAYLAVLWLRLGRLDRSLALAREAVDHGAEVPENDVIMGEDALQRGSLEEAIGFFGRAMEGQPRLLGAWDGLIRTLRTMDRPEEALEAMEHAVGKNPGMLDWWLELVLTRREQDQPEEAARLLRAALQEHPQDPRLLALAQEILKVSDDNDPVATEIASLRARLDQGAVEEVTRALNAAQRRYPSDQRLRFFRYEVTAANPRSDVADLVLDLGEVCKRYPSEWEPRLTLGGLLLRQSRLKNPRLAMDYLEQAWRMSGQDPRAGVVLVEAYLARKKVALAYALAARLADAGEEIARRLCAILPVEPAPEE
jgi:tetratricopeptide (TPR) repeat protein